MDLAALWPTQAIIQSLQYLQMFKAKLVVGNTYTYIELYQPNLDQFTAKVVQEFAATEEVSNIPAPHVVGEEVERLAASEQFTTNHSVSQRREYVIKRQDYHRNQVMQQLQHGSNAEIVRDEGAAHQPQQRDEVDHQRQQQNEAVQQFVESKITELAGQGQRSTERERPILMLYHATQSHIIGQQRFYTEIATAYIEQSFDNLEDKLVSQVQELLADFSV